jgi:hypothetical protein
MAVTFHKEMITNDKEFRWGKLNKMNRIEDEDVERRIILK